MKSKQSVALTTVFLVLVFSASASAYVAPNLLFCKNVLTMRSGTVYVNGVAHSETGLIQADAGDEIAFDFTIANDNSPACQKPVTAVLAFYGSSKDYPENWFSYKFKVETTHELNLLPGSFMKIQNQVPGVQYSFSILQGEVIRAKLSVKTPADAKTTLLAFGAATAYLVPGTKNEVVLNTTSTLDFKPIVLSGRQTTIPTPASTQPSTAPTLAQAEQRQPAQQADWNLILAVLAVLAILVLAARFLTAKRRAEHAFETLPRERAYERELESKRERKHAHARKHAREKR